MNYTTITYFIILTIFTHSKENTVLRASVMPEKVSVIPNALDTVVFRPRKSIETNPDRSKSYHLLYRYI